MTCLLQSARSERGNTFFEVLVVALIVGILTVLALPAFADEKKKGGDAKTKSIVRVGLTAATENYVERGSYALTKAQLIELQPALVNARDLSYTGDATSFEISAETYDGRRFGIRSTGGSVTRFCSPAGEGTCRPDGSW